MFLVWECDGSYEQLLFLLASSCFGFIQFLRHFIFVSFICLFILSNFSDLSDVSDSFVCLGFILSDLSDLFVCLGFICLSDLSDLSDAFPPFVRYAQVCFIQLVVNVGICKLQIQTLHQCGWDVFAINFVIFVSSDSFLHIPWFVFVGSDSFLILVCLYSFISSYFLHFSDFSD